MKLSGRISGVSESATIRLIDISNRLKSEGKNVVNFSFGEPDFDTPSHIVDAAKRAMDAGFTHYLPSGGLPELKEAVARKLKQENNLNLVPDNVVITPGAKYAIYAVINSIIDDGDEVILIDPSWVTYPACVNLAGGKVVWTRFDRIGDAITQKTKLILINSPNNPAGYVLDRKELKMIADLAIDHDITVVSDEIYEKLIYEKKHLSIGSFDGMDERTITINGFSKTYAMTGWRVGYLAAPEEVASAVKRLQQHSTTCATSFAQYGAIEAISGDQSCVEQMVNRFRERRDLIVEGLNEIGIPCQRPAGAFYVFADVGAFGGGERVAEDLLNKAHVIVTPGGAFGPESDSFIRISYATSIDQIRLGLEGMKTCLG
ncbi:MAG: aspartate aminotransferase [Candidatus Syntrophoarchaeum caldarius]|uniref:Aminotransferase n=1 Tax=Candidatus Syntropharchaeum caldarium TaxID=1838285 RepID=A0A1F2PBV8_9EURY|nr:MAG: aspartate aminotransferase [Candidatus Syntrophoarchaeum caldarius]